MSAKKAVLLLAGGVTVLGTQILSTIRDRHTWPFCAYNMFNYRSKQVRKQLRIALYDTEGALTGPLDPWSLLPIEFFRVVSVLEKIFFDSDDPRIRAEFCVRTLRRINTTHWRDFDEVRGAVSAASGLPFAALDIYLVEVDDARCDPRDRAAVLTSELVHRHDPDGVIGAIAPRWSSERRS